MTLVEILRRACPKTHSVEQLNQGCCNYCSPFKAALDQAKREGYKVALHLVEFRPDSAASVLRSLIECAPPR